MATAKKSRYEWIRRNRDLPIEEQPNDEGVREVLRKAREESNSYGDPVERLKERIKLRGTDKFKAAEDAAVYQWIVKNKNLPLEEQPNDVGVREVLRKAREEARVYGDPLERLKERIKLRGIEKFKAAEDATVYRWILDNKDLPLEEQPDDVGVRQVLRQAHEASRVTGDPLVRLKEWIKQNGPELVSQGQDKGVYLWIYRNKNLPVDKQPDDPGVREVLRRAREKR